MQVTVQAGHLSIQAAFPLTFIGILTTFIRYLGSEQHSVWIANKARMILLLWFATACTAMRLKRKTTEFWVLSDPLAYKLVVSLLTDLNYMILTRLWTDFTGLKPSNHLPNANADL